jgi:hypothetical protein
LSEACWWLANQKHRSRHDGAAQAQLSIQGCSAEYSQSRVPCPACRCR